MNAKYFRFPLLFALLVVGAGCSLLVDFDECVQDADCSAGGICDDGICEPPDRVIVTDFIVEDTTWTTGNTYVLENLIFVVAPATLTIEPGVVVVGKRNTGLVSLAGARLEAVGTRDEPIVFTSDKPVGQRLAGDWAGLAMVGRAPVNREDFNLRIDTEEDTSVGGSDPTSDCGTLRFVRIEFGGSEVDGQKALKGLTLAGCGSETEVEFVQTHLSDDDGVGVFGGTVDLRFIVSTRARDDAFDFDTGWQGTAQFLAVQQDNVGIEAIEVENLAEDPVATPQTRARIYNYTLIGADREGDRQVGLFVKLGGQALFSHGIVTGHKTSGLLIDGPEAAQHANDGEITIQNTLFNNLGEGGTNYLGPSPMEEVDGELIFENYDIFKMEETNNLFGADPGFTDPHNLQSPTWVPDPGNTTGVEPPPAPFDPTAVYRGAFSPSAPPWTEGWTDYPLN